MPRSAFLSILIPLMACGPCSLDLGPTDEVVVPEEPPREESSATVARAERFAAGEETHTETEASLAEGDAACEGGDAARCREVGLAYAEGQGVEADTTRARTYLRSACTGEDADGCYALAMIGLREGGTVEDAMEILDRACALGGDTACQQRIDIELNGYKPPCEEEGCKNDAETP